MRNRVLFIGLILTLLLILAACGGGLANEKPEQAEIPSVENEVKVEEPDLVEEDLDDSFEENVSDDFYYETETIMDGLSYFEKYWYSGKIGRAHV